MTLRKSLICKSDLILAASVVFFLESKMKFFFAKRGKRVLISYGKQKKITFKNFLGK